MSDLQSLFDEIAQEMGKKPGDLNKFIQIFEDQMYDTVESLKDVEESFYKEYKVPHRLAQLISQKVNGTQVVQQPVQQKPIVQQQQQQFIQQQQQQVIQQQPMEIEPVQQQNSMQETKVSQEQVNIEHQNEQLVQDLYMEMRNDQNFMKTAQLLYKIFFNIKSNLNEDKFRTLKKENATLQQIVYQYQNAILILLAVNFQDKNDVYYMHSYQLENTRMEGIMKILKERAEGVASVQNQQAQQQKVSNVAKPKGIMDEAGVESFYSQLERLKAKRKQIMSQPVINRNIKCFLKQNLVYEEYDENQEKDQAQRKEYNVMMRKAVVQMQQEKAFSSKRQKEHAALVQRPVYAQTIIRVRFSNDIILEIAFSPLERVSHVYQIVKEQLNADYDFYLYDTPPRRILEGKLMNSTLDDLEAVPGGIWNFGLRDAKLEKSQQYFLKQSYIDQALQGTTQQNTFQQQQQL